MVRSSKWIGGTNPRQPITEVARQALRERSRAVWRYARLAADRWSEDIEHVHRLRVATRRARAALRLFADYLPQRQTRWMKKTLRRLRRAAGDARDLDVLGQRLGKMAAANGDSRVVAVLELIAARRRKAQRPLAYAARKAKRQGFKRRSRALARAVRWRSKGPEPTLAEAARTMLAPLVDEFFASARADLSDIKAQHQMRISGKRVRYAMELLAGAFDNSFGGDLDAAFREVQERLGSINDHATAIAMLNEWSQRVEYNASRAELAQLIASEQQRLGAMRQEFRDWWTAARVEELSRHFARVLAVPATSAEMPDSPQSTANERQRVETVPATAKEFSNRS